MQWALYDEIEGASQAKNHAYDAPKLRQNSAVEICNSIC
jgi:hypothetical protein